MNFKSFFTRRGSGTSSNLKAKEDVAGRGRLEGKGVPLVTRYIALEGLDNDLGRTEQTKEAVKNCRKKNVRICKIAVDS
jgi:hypothetical protein